jgi:acyl-CoA synthetase (AMP-forming)/AMP-acid ligase II
VFLSSIYGGRTLVVEPQFDAGNWLKLVEQEGVTRATVVPTMLKMAIEHPDFASRDLSSLQILTYGAAPMPHGVITAAIERLPDVRFINAFGQTETGATITALPPQDHDLTGDPELVAKRKRRLGSIGLPLDDVEVRVVDEDGEQVAEGEVGEIVARGPRLMKGYWRRDDATAETMHGGWLHTGDLGRVDGDGYVYLSGRAKDFIKRGGEMVSPEEVEAVLREHPAVEDAAIIGVPDAHWGESVRAVVVPATGQAIDQDELVEHCRAKLASFKKPESVVVIDELPRNALGKVLKRELRERFGEA